jgi:hypothetical protein
MTYLILLFAMGLAIWFLGPIVTKTVTTSIKKIRKEYNKED